MFISNFYTNTPVINGLSCSYRYRYRLVTFQSQLKVAVVLKLLISKCGNVSIGTIIKVENFKGFPATILVNL